MPMAKRTVSNQLLFGHVLDVIYGEDSIWYNGADSVGAVRIRVIPVNYNAPEDEQTTLAYPLDRTHYRVPLPGETVAAFISFGPSVQGIYQSRYYYWKIVTADQNLTYSGLPFTGTDPYHLKAGPKILVSDADKKTFAKRFDDKLGIDKDLLADKSSLQQPRLGERTIESRFGSMIKFSSSPSDQSTWDEETQVNNSLATSEGDPLLIINVDRKVVGSALTLKDISVDKTKGDDTNMFLTTTQNVPISLGCSTRMLSWDVDLRAGILDAKTGALANLAAEFGGGFDANGGFKIALKGDIQFEDANFDGPSPDGTEFAVGGAVGSSTAAKNGAPHYNDGTMYQRAWAIDGFTYGLGSRIGNSGGVSGGNSTTDPVTNGKFSIPASELQAWLASGKPASANTPAGTYTTGKGAKANIRSINRFSIDCSGFVAYVLGLSGGSSESQMAGSNNLIKVKTIDYTTLAAGDVIGADHGSTSFDGGRALGIDHIAVVIQDPTSKALYLAESHGGKGVHIRELAKGIASWNSSRTLVTHYVGNYRPATTPTA